MRKSPLRNFDYWKGLGFAVVPKDKRSGSLALNARDYLSALPCWKQASNMVDAGYMPGEIADFIRNQNGGDLGVTLLTLKKYIQLYRRHFVRPLTAVRSTAARIKVEDRKRRVPKSVTETVVRPPKAGSQARQGGDATGKPPPPPGDGGGQVSRQTLEKLAAFRSGVNEIALMEQVILLQLERVKSQRELEVALGFPMPNLWREIEQITKLGGTLVNLKADLGLDGYLRVPRMIHGKRTHDLAPRMLAGLSDEDRRAVAEFGQTLTDLIRQADGSYVEEAEEE